MKKKDLLMLFLTLSILTLVLFVCAVFFVNKITDHIPCKWQTDYSKYNENTPEETVPLSVDNKIVVVYVTTYGEKYHRENCRYLRYTKKEILLEDAIILHYAPCTVCNP